MVLLPLPLLLRRRPRLVVPLLLVQFLSVLIVVVFSSFTAGCFSVLTGRLLL